MTDQNVLIVGSGGREHAIAKALYKSPYKPTLYAYSSCWNPGLLALVGRENMRVASTFDPDAILDFSKANHINYVVIGPEAVLASGLPDLLRANRIAVIGANKGLAQIETSKRYCRDLMFDCGLHDYSPRYYSYSPLEDIDYPLEAIKEFKDGYVIKADGLHSGKGVKVSGDHLRSINDAVKYIFEIIDKNEYYLVEERLYGQEFSIMSFCDGDSFSHMPPCQDFKRRNQGDTGPNTGSMGSITYANHMLPFLIPADIEKAEYIIEKVGRELMKKEGDVYCGILYGSFIKTYDGKIKVIEFNSRFGDPECINVLELLETDLHQIFIHMINRTLVDITISYKSLSSAFKYLIPYEYPLSKGPSREVRILKGANTASHIYAGINVALNRYYTTGSRVMGVIHLAKSVKEAATLVNDEIRTYLDPLLDYRVDIGFKGASSSSYLSSGVDVNKMDKAILSIKESVESTHGDEVISKWGDYAGLYSLASLNEDENILVTSTDGVGTKSVFMRDQLGIRGEYECGIDIVNHCVNDILVKGARPLFFLNYYAADVVQPEGLLEYVKGISVACKEVGCALVGGETAEMPGVYARDKSDMVGAIVGVVSKRLLIDGQKSVQEGDVVYALPSDGPHTNGYSLIRKIVKSSNDRIEPDIMDLLLKNHRCYYNEIQTLRGVGVDIHGMVHITGGGYGGNIKRVIRDDLMVSLKRWSLPEPYDTLQIEGNIDTEEMYNTFNCGFGMLLFVNKTDIRKISETLKEGSVIGIVSKRVEGAEKVMFI